MSDLIKMYQLKPIIKHDIRVDLPNCMYKMKNILASNDVQVAVHVSCTGAHLGISEQVMKFLKNHNNQEMAELQARQEKILQQLEELKLQMMNLKDILKVPETTAKSVESVANITCAVKGGNVNIEQINKYSDFVINVNPSNPPYSLLLLQRLWSNDLNIIVKNHIHSTVKSLPELASALAAELATFEGIDTAPKIIIRLIWKNVDQKMELVTSPSAITPIYGEANILRYFSRIGPNHFNYELLSNPQEVDHVLDVCYLMSRARTKTERHSLMQILNGKLGKSQWLCNSNSIGIADIAASSIIKQVTCENEVNVNLTKWIHRCT